MSEGAFEVAVVGAGPAGAAIAIALGRRGRRVVLLDRARFPRDKPCGEGLMPQGAAALRDLGVLPALLAAGAQRFQGIRYHAGPPGTAPAAGLFPEVAGERAGLAVRRIVLDAALVEAARRTPGVEVREGTAARDLLRDAAGRAAGLILENGERVPARVVVGADGLRSLVRRRLGLERPSGMRPRYAVVGHVGHDPLPPSERAFVDVLVGAAGAGGGEAYLTPVAPGETGIVFLLERRAARAFGGRRDDAFRELVRALVPRLGPALAAAVEPAALLGPTLATGPLAVRPASLAADGAILAGDAAGFLDGITGEGVSLSLATAPLAAAAIDRALDRGDVSRAAFLPYERARRALAREGDVLTRALLYLAERPRFARAAIAGLRHAPGVFRWLLGVNCGVYRIPGMSRAFPPIFSR